MQLCFRYFMKSILLSIDHISEVRHPVFQDDNWSTNTAYFLTNAANDHPSRQLLAVLV